MFYNSTMKRLNPLNAKLNPICHLLALLGAHHILHVSRIRVKAKLCSEQIRNVSEIMLVAVYLAFLSSFSSNIYRR